MTVPMRNPNKMKEIREFRKRFWEMVEEAESIVITGHLSSDDDSVASMLAVYWLVVDKFPKKMIRMICTGKPVDDWEYFEGFGKIEFVEELVDEFVGLDPFTPEVRRRRNTNSGETSSPLVVFLDGSRFDRFSKKPEKLKEIVGKTVCIDHHKNKVDDFDLLYVSPALSATAEGVYRLLTTDKKKIPKRLAEIFLLGILEDTGNFAYLNKETVQVLEVVQKLIYQADINIKELQSKYRRYSKRILKFVGEMISNTKYFKKTKERPAFQVGMVSREFVDRYKFSDEEISKASHLYMANYLCSVKGYGWGLSITPRNNSTCSLSFRSLPNVVNVRELAKNFDGGGHDLASAGEINVSEPKEAVALILKALRLY
jgi:nanoRNase/pAp phosphatase (c-di-AMP/oligoRNAs hydrolase)